MSCTSRVPGSCGGASSSAAGEKQLDLSYEQRNVTGKRENKPKTRVGVRMRVRVRVRVRVGGIKHQPEGSTDHW